MRGDKRVERIVIKKLRPIDYCDFNINDFTIFTGPQASGKSTIAKSIFFFKNIRNLISKAARPFNSRLDKSKLVEAGFTPLPTWQDALSRYLKEIEY